MHFLIGFISVLSAILLSANSAPQFRLTAAEYSALQFALQGAVPVNVQRGSPILSIVDDDPENFVVLNFPGPVGAGGSGNVGGSAAGPIVDLADSVDARTFDGPILDLGDIVDSRSFGEPQIVDNIGAGSGAGFAGGDGTVVTTAGNAGFSGGAGSVGVAGGGFGAGASGPGLIFTTGSFEDTNDIVEDIFENTADALGFDRSVERQDFLTSPASFSVETPDFEDAQLSNLIETLTRSKRQTKTAARLGTALATVGGLFGPINHVA